MRTDLCLVDAELVEPIAAPDAERLDKRIRLLVTTINDNISKLYTLVQEAKAGQIHVALGFPSWTAYVADVFKPGVQLDRGQRRELVGYLSGEGMSQRAIAAVVSTGVGTVNRDLAGVPLGTPDGKPEPVATAEHIDVIDTEDDATKDDCPDCGGSLGWGKYGLRVCWPCHRKNYPKCECGAVTNSPDEIGRCEDCHDAEPDWVGLIGASLDRVKGGVTAAREHLTQAKQEHPGEDFSELESLVSQAEAEDYQDDDDLFADDHEQVVLADVDNHPEPTITGLDGKTYQRKPPQPQVESKPRRGPITESFWRARFEMGKATNRLVKLATDDRFGRNVETLARDNLGDLIRMRNELNEVIGRLQADGVRSGGGDHAA